tara:strand:+ start:46 stop:297 length:252 start_codon:yes stop_codon:yes gene_type:complete
VGAVPKEHWPDSEGSLAYMFASWQEPWGDRRQEIVFIGTGIDWPELKGRLDECLLPKLDAMSLATLPDLPDPFPVWRRMEAAE